MKFYFTLTTLALLSATLMSGCPITVTNDQKNMVFVSDPNSGRAVLLEGRGLILPNSSMTIDPSLHGIKKLMSKVNLVHEQLDFWIAQGDKQKEFFGRDLRLTHYYCNGASKLTMSQITQFASKPTDRWSAERIMATPLSGKGCVVALTNDSKRAVFMTNADKGVLIAPSGFFSASKTQSLPSHDVMNVYVEKTAHQFYLKYRISFKCQAKGVALKVSDLDRLAKNPDAQVSVEILAEQKIPTAAEQKILEEKMSMGFANVRDQQLKEAAFRCKQLPFDQQEQCFFEAQSPQEPLDY